MSSPRTAPREVVRLLDAASVPVYLIDASQAIVYMNAACAQWLALAPGDLIGRVCRYQSGQTDPLAAAADALAPPPEIWHGQPASGLIAARRADGSIERRRAQFVPLDADDGVAGVVAIAAPSALTDEELAAPPPEPKDSDEARRLHEVVRTFRCELAERHHPERLAGTAPAMRRLRSQVDLAARGAGSVLLVGRPGSGREHLARTIHFAQDEPRGAIIPVSCSALPGELLVSTLETLPARSASPAGERSSVVLVDVDRAPREVQRDIARWVADSAAKFRVLATATENLEAMAQRGQYDAELALLLSTLLIEIPPLAERAADLPALAQLLVEDENAAGKKQLAGFTPEALDLMAGYAWPGEMDELVEAVRESFAAAEGPLIGAADLPKKLRLAAEAARHPRKPPMSIDLEAFLARIEKELIDRALTQAKGNKSRAARLLGLTRPRLYRRMEQLGMAPPAGADGPSDEPTPNEPTPG